MIPDFLKKHYLLTTFFFVFIFLPYLILEIYSYDGIFSLITRFICFSSLLVFCIVLSKYLEHKNSIIKYSLFFIFFLYYILTYLFAAYLAFSRTPFKIVANIELGLNSITHGLVGILGYFNIALVFVAVILLFLLTSHFFRKVTKNIHKEFGGKIAGLLLLLTVVFLVTGNDLVVSSVIDAYQDYEATKNNPVVFPDYNFSTTSNENIFLLQLESLNSAIVTKEYSPNFLEIAKDGVLLKKYHNNSIRTNLAQDNILCGINGNFKTPFSHHPEDIKNTCLPQLLKDSGYKTLFFRADILEFTNTGNYMKAIGFEEIHHDDIMQEGDLKYPWGYDDALFYKRTFEYLNKYYKDTNNLFIYLEVSSHHIPFSEKEEYGNHVFLEPQNFTEKYINSAYVQDMALKTFYDDFKKYTNGNTHLIIQGDHSWPIGIHGNVNNEKGYYEDNFLTSLIFIGKKGQGYLTNYITEERFSEVDTVPTIFSILNKEQYENSFEPALKGQEPTNYEKCHMLIQPHMDMSASIVKYPDKYVYLLKLKEIHYFNLANDPNEMDETVLAKDIGLKDFLMTYGCERYKEYYSKNLIETEE